MMKKLAVFMAFCAIATTSADGGSQLPAEKIAADAKWVFFLDVSQFRDGTLWTGVQEKFSDTRMQKGIEMFQDRLGYHPVEDVDTVVMYGNVMERGKGVFLMEGDFNVKRMVSVVKEKKDYGSEEHDGMKLHHWKHSRHGRTMEVWGTALGSEQILVADSRERLTSAVSVVRQEEKQLDVESPLVSSYPSGNVVGYAATLKFPEVGGKSDSQKAEILKRTSEGHAFVREQGRDLNMKMSLKAATEEDSQKIQDILKGMLALTSLEGTGKEQPSSMRADILQSVEISRSGKRVHAEVSFPSRKLLKAMSK